MIKRLLIIAALILVPALARADEPLLEQPHWSLEVKGGFFYPDIDNWETFYGSKRTGHFAGSLAYKIFRNLEAGFEGGYISDKGRGFAPQHGLQTGSVKYELAPIHAFILLRGMFSESQLLTPYAGGGWTRMFYREKVENQDEVRGSVDGYHARAGLQLLLDDIDPSAANSFYLDYGVQHTYLFVEAQYIRAMTDDISGASVNLGGTSYLAGFLFEF
jgi:hypothetical protein